MSGDDVSDFSVWLSECVELSSSGSVSDEILTASEGGVLAETPSASELIELALEDLDRARRSVALARIAFVNEIRPLAQRPNVVRIDQIGNITDKLSFDSQPLIRNKGDMVIHRGKYILARLKITTLLKDADAAELITWKRPFEKVRCTHPDILAFLRTIHPTYEYDYVELEVTGHHPRTGKRMYLFSSTSFSTCIHRRFNYTDAKEMLSDCERMEECMEEAFEKMEQLRPKRKRLEEKESLWSEDPRLRFLTRKHSADLYRE